MRPEPERFFDGGSVDGAVGPGPDRPVHIRLERIVEPRNRRVALLPARPPFTERFRLERRVAYQARGFPEPHVVPADDRFRTDLTSVPDLFTWLVPRTGIYLPAALLHDALVLPTEPRHYLGPPVTRTTADTIFRHAMADLGTAPARRWLMWTAVSLTTVSVGVGRSAVSRWYHRVAVFGSLAVITVLGVLATLDLFDTWDVLPWMGDRSLPAELAYGVLFAVLIPAALAALWGRLWRAGLIAGIALALLLHITIALAGLTAVFRLVEYATTPARELQGVAAAQDSDPGPPPGD